MRQVSKTSHAVTTMTRMWTWIVALAGSSIVWYRLHRVASRVRMAWRGSSAETGARKGQQGLRKLVGGSIIYSGLRRLVRRGPEIYHLTLPSSTVAAVVSRGVQLARSSFIYRWLTSEPDPEVVVIDLRETYSVGPVIASVDRTIATITPGISSATVTQATRATVSQIRLRPVRYLSLVLLVAVVMNLGLTMVFGRLTQLAVLVHVVIGILALVGSRSNSSYDDLKETRLFNALARVFEPPEPPDRSGP